ncbi:MULTISPECIES: hypothetical protein [unclassified Pseudomonas]|uniref:hypothetical protein n=1 Tax=unclassified Pseudomonas TaxID=196821 RepID=UPI000CD14120|nr:MULTISPECIES: hypothetical protein [unclassified Pseudomonas]POA15944.1 hypothetical protein C1892_03400 [Pseudomonas sp. MPBD7-1]
MKNFKYFALMYLNDWHQWDQPFSERIFSSNKTQSLQAFHHAAKYYKVTRNFRIDKTESRLQGALDLVRSGRGKLTEKNVCEKVNQLALAFEKRYGKNAVSAASKFLWLRYKSPVVIFDSRAKQWLNKNGYKVPNHYEGYREQWLAAFSDHSLQIERACAALVNAHDFSMAFESSPKEIVPITTSLWFKERVFDKYLWFNAGN